MSDTKLSFHGLILKVLSFVSVCCFGGFTWWMTVVWANQTEQAKQISGIESRLSSLESKADGINEKVDRVQNGVDTLIKLAIKAS